MLFAYFEKNDVYRENLLFYLKHGAPDATHSIVIINGESALETPSLVKENVQVLLRPNTGLDFGGWSFALNSLGSRIHEFTHVIFLNGSCRGPFLPSFMPLDFKWTRAFTDALDTSTRLVGPTINPVERNGGLSPTVQTYAFGMETATLQLLRAETALFATEYGNIYDVIEHQEIGLSTEILKRGWNISCFVHGLRGLDYRTLTHSPNPWAACYAGDIVFPGPRAFGRQIHPFEVMFIKMNRGIEEAAVSLTATM